MEGLLQESYLEVAGFLDSWEWWPLSLKGQTVADVGCFTGGLSLLMGHRNAEKVCAIDEVPEHLAQCRFLAELFRVESVQCLESSLYELPKKMPPGSLDLILLSGVLYHLSDMLVGLLSLQTLLKPEGVLIIESSAIECFEHSYANFCRFCGGAWWQPTALCIQDMCMFTGLNRPEIRFYTKGRCLARTVKKPGAQIPFRRGINWKFSSLRDEIPRSMDLSIMTPAPCDHDDQ
jgi:SAM-dependent methyltransferase